MAASKSNRHVRLTLGVDVTPAALADISPAELQPLTGLQRSSVDWTK
jgi:hypothetical protein